MFLQQVPTEEELAVKVYSDRINVDAKKIMNWLKSNIDRLEKKVRERKGARMVRSLTLCSGRFYSI